MASPEILAALLQPVPVAASKMAAGSRLSSISSTWPAFDRCCLLDGDTQWHDITVPKSLQVKFHQPFKLFNLFLPCRGLWASVQLCKPATGVLELDATLLPDPKKAGLLRENVSKSPNHTGLIGLLAFALQAQ